MDDSVSQGNQNAEVKPEVQEKLTEMKQEAQTLAERSKTVDERLNKIISAEPTPSSNQTDTPLETKDTEQPLPDNAEKVALENSKNPERTREYIEKLKAENKRLREGGSVFDSLRQVPQQPELPPVPSWPVQPVQPVIEDFVQPDGTVDIAGLNNALKAANIRAANAETQAWSAVQRVQESEEQRQVREAHREFPELDPNPTNEKFDPNFYDLVALRIAKSGMKMSLLDAAAEVRQSYSPSSSPVNLEKVRDEAITQYKENLARRNQTPLSSSQGENRVEAPIQELRERTRKGDPFALDERLRKLGLIK